MSGHQSKETFLVVQFKLATSPTTFFTLTNWDQGFTGDVGPPLNSVVATYVKGLEFELPPNTGFLDKEPLFVRFVLGENANLDSVVQGLQVPFLDATVVLVQREIGPGAAGRTDFQIGTYRLVKAIRTANGVKGACELQFLSCKQRLDTPLGVIASSRCVWTLGDKTCQASVFTSSGTVATLTRKSLFLTSPADVGVVTQADGRYWHRGFIEFDGLRIGIRDWDGASPQYEFKMVQAPPLSWLGQSVVLTPGCDKTAGVCDSRWGRLESFGGFGIAIPNYQPLYEEA